MAPMKEIQFDLFPSAPALTLCAETLELMRPHKWATGETVQLALATIELAPHEGKWMWSSSLKSHNGSGQGGKALPKWGKFADTKVEALLQGVEDVQAFMHRATETEQQRIIVWLSELVSSVHAESRTSAQ